MAGRRPKKKKIDKRSTRMRGTICSTLLRRTLSYTHKTPLSISLSHCPLFLTRQGIFLGAWWGGGCWQGSGPIWSTEDKTPSAVTFFLKGLVGVDGGGEEVQTFSDEHPAVPLYPEPAPPQNAPSTHSPTHLIFSHSQASMQFVSQLLGVTQCTPPRIT